MNSSNINVWVMIDIRDIPSFKGYLFVWCIRAYCFYYMALLRISFKTMRVGNITESLMNVIKGLVYSQRLVVANLEQERLLAVEAYSHLSHHS